MTLVRPSEVDQFIEEGLLPNASHLKVVYEKAHMFLRHNCSARCLKHFGVENNQLKCRVGNNKFESPNPREHCIKEIVIHHSEPALAVLTSVGLYAQNASTGQLTPTHDLLHVTKHYPPAYAAEGIVSPCNGCLFVANSSNQNLKIVTGYLLSRYLAKYVAGIDENNKVFIGARVCESNAVSLDYKFLHNTKVTGSAIQESKRLEQRRDKRHPTGCPISEMEMIAILLGYDQVHTNIKFVQVPTLPLEERCAMDRPLPMERLIEQKIVSSEHARNASPTDLDSNAVIPCFAV